MPGTGVPLVVRRVAKRAPERAPRGTRPCLHRIRRASAWRPGVVRPPLPDAVIDHTVFGRARRRSWRDPTCSGVARGISERGHRASAAIPGAGIGGWPSSRDVAPPWKVQGLVRSGGAQRLLPVVLELRWRRRRRRARRCRGTLPHCSRPPDADGRDRRFRASSATASARGRLAFGGVREPRRQRLEVARRRRADVGVREDCDAPGRASLVPVEPLAASDRIRSSSVGTLPADHPNPAAAVVALGQRPALPSPRRTRRTRRSARQTAFHSAAPGPVGKYQEGKNSDQRHADAQTNRIRIVFKRRLYGTRKPPAYVTSTILPRAPGCRTASGAPTPGEFAVDHRAERPRPAADDRGVDGRDRTLPVNRAIPMTASRPMACGIDLDTSATATDHDQPELRRAPRSVIETDVRHIPRDDVKAAPSVAHPISAPAYLCRGG